MAKNNVTDFKFQPSILIKFTYCLVMVLVFETYSYSQVKILGLKTNITKDSLITSSNIYFEKPPAYVKILLDNSENSPLEFRITNSVSEEWQDLGIVSHIILFNLDGNDYFAEVRIKNNINEKPGSINFSIAKPFWQKWWFIPVFLIYLVFILSLIVYIFFRYRFRQEAKLKRVRDILAADLHDDVGATLSSIKMYSEYIKSEIQAYPNSEKINAVINKLSSASQDSIEVMRSLVWSINPINQDQSSFQNKIKIYAEDLLEIKNIKYQFEWNNIKIYEMHILLQRNLLLIFKEIFNNISKHSQAKNVLIQVKSIEKENIQFLIKDDGIGFDLQNVNKNNGIINLKKRSSDMGAILEIKTKLGSGTEIKILISQFNLKF